MDTTSGNDLSGETLTSAPPSPQEVKVRTMQSDLASMAQSGGGLPQFQNVKITGVSASSQDAPKSNRKASLVVAILSIAAVLIVLAAGYFAYVVLQRKNTTTVPVTVGQ